MHRVKRHGTQPARAAVLAAHGQYARIVNSWVEQLGLDRADYGTHALRRTKATLSYRRRKNLRTVQSPLGADRPTTVN